MKHSNTHILMVLTLVVSALSACGQPAGAVDNQALVNTAVAGTTTAQAGFDQAVQAALDATASAQVSIAQAVQATVIALPPTATPGPQVDYYTLTEDELAALIDQSVAEAVYSSQQASSATTQSTADGTMTTEEIYATVELVYEAEAALETAEYLIDAYYDLYGEYAGEALDVLKAIEEDLTVIAANLEENTELLEQGAQAASAAIEQLNAAAVAIDSSAGETQVNLEGWQEKVQATIETREQVMLNTTPNEIPGDRNVAILKVHEYLDAVKQALGDQKISPGELNQIAQLGANAKAGLERFGGLGTNGLSGAIDDLTRNLARGEWPQARGNLGGFEASLPPRPRR